MLTKFSLDTNSVSLGFNPKVQSSLRIQFNMDYFLNVRKAIIVSKIWIVICPLFEQCVQEEKQENIHATQILSVLNPVSPGFNFKEQSSTRIQVRLLFEFEQLPLFPRFGS